MTAEGEQELIREWDAATSCPCGHTVDPFGYCLIDDRYGTTHRVMRSSNHCVDCRKRVENV